MAGPGSRGGGPTVGGAQEGKLVTAGLRDVQAFAAVRAAAVPPGVRTHAPPPKAA